MSDKSTETALAEILAAIEALHAKLSPGALDNLPPELARNHIVDNSGACEFYGHFACASAASASRRQGPASN